MTYQPSQELADFLAAGEPPVCVTFGSMVSRESDRIRQIVQTALAQTGLRGILLTGWGGIKPDNCAPDLFCLEAAPHNWLFAHCKMVIHHGDAGTTSAALRAGLPIIVIPHGIDQWFWGKRIAAMGIGPAPIGLSNLSVETLASAILQAKNPGVGAKAQENGYLIRNENGVAEAVYQIEQHID